MARYQFFYPRKTGCQRSEPECSMNESLEDAMANATSMVESGIKEIIVLEIDNADLPVRVVGRVVEQTTAEVTVY